MVFRRFSTHFFGFPNVDPTSTATSLHLLMCPGEEAALASPAPFLLQKYYYHSHQPESGWCELLVILFWNQFTMINDAKSTPTKISAPRKTSEATDSCSIPAQFCFNAVFPFLSGWRVEPLPPLARRRVARGASAPARASSCGGVVG